MTEVVGHGAIPSFSDTASPLITRRLANKKIELIQEIDSKTVSGALAKTTQQAYEKITAGASQAKVPQEMKEMLPVAKKKGADTFYYAKVETLAKEFGLTPKEVTYVQSQATAAEQAKAFEYIVLKRELHNAITSNDFAGVMKILVDARGGKHSPDRLLKELSLLLTTNEKSFVKAAVEKMKNLTPIMENCKSAIEKKDFNAFVSIAQRAQGEDLSVGEIVTLFQHTPFIKESADQVASMLEEGESRKIREHFGIGVDAQKIRGELQAVTALLEPGNRVKAYLDRFDAISSSLEGQKHGLKPYEMLELALFVENSFQNEPTAFRLYPQAQGKPPREIFVDSANKTFYLLSGLQMLAQTKNSTVHEALKIQEGAKAEQYVRKQVPVTQELAKEVEYTQKFGDSTLISTTTKVTLVRSSVEVAVIITKRFDFDFSQCLASADEPKELSMGQKMKNFVEIGLHLFDLHDQGYVHDDVKADNAASTKGVAHLVDFGETRKAGSRPPSVTRYSTPHYTAPEAIRGEALLGPVEQDKAMDAYALGCMFYELTHTSELPWFAVDVTAATLASTSPAAKEMVDKQQKTHEALLAEAKGEKEPLRKKALEVCTKLLDPNPKTRMTLDAFLKEMSAFDPKYKEMILNALKEKKAARELTRAFAQFSESEQIDSFDKVVSTRLSQPRSIDAFVRRLDADDRKELQRAFKAFLVPMLAEAIRKRDGVEILTLCKKGALILPDNSFVKEALQKTNLEMGFIHEVLSAAVIDSLFATEAEKAAIDLMIQKIAPEMR